VFFPYLRGMKYYFLFLLFQVANFFAQDMSIKNPIESKSDFVLGEKRTFYSEVLQESRSINVYLPEGYQENDSSLYSVIYLLDGSGDEDFIHVAGLVQFLSFPWIATLENTILVGIENVDRKRDFTFPTSIEKDKIDFPTTGSSEKFITFIEKELQTFVTKNYKVNSERSLIGQSLGALLATEILLKKPQLFNRYFIVSPSLWWDNQSLLQKINLIETQNYKELEVYISVGQEGKIMINDAKNLEKSLRKKGVNSDFQFFPEENHATILHDALYHSFLKMKKKNTKK
jgi:predicted alpha/beta superfamily hydrolase